jgi:hypothetical protein
LGKLAPIGAAVGMVGMVMEVAGSQIPESVGSAIKSSNDAFRRLKNEFKKVGITKFNPYPVRSQGDGFDEIMQKSAELSAEIYDASSALLSANPNDAARFLNLYGDQSKTSIAAHIKEMIENGEGRQIRFAGKDMAQTMKKINERERKQAEYFDLNPEAASRWHARAREMKYQDEQRARALRDWSRA